LLPYEIHSIKAEDYPYEDDCVLDGHATMILSRHSHAPLEVIWKRCNGWTISISIPCCGDFGEIKDTPIWFSYEDYEIPSPKRRVLVHKK